MATTSPDNIKTPDSGDQYALVQDLGALADTVQNALVRRANSYAGTSAQRLAFTSAADGVKWQDTNGAQMEWIRIAGNWRAVVWHTSVVIPVVNATGATIPLTFPSGAFARAPHIQVSRGSGGTAKYIPYSNNTSATGTTIGVFAGDNTAGNGNSVVNVSVYSI